jgi:hypothetical protein
MPLPTAFETRLVGLTEPRAYLFEQLASPGAQSDSRAAMRRWAISPHGNGA